VWERKDAQQIIQRWDKSFLFFWIFHPFVLPLWMLNVVSVFYCLLCWFFFIHYNISQSFSSSLPCHKFLAFNLHWHQSKLSPKIIIWMVPIRNSCNLCHMCVWVWKKSFLFSLSSLLPTHRMMPSRKYCNLCHPYWYESPPQPSPKNKWLLWKQALLFFVSLANGS
jgi:hypothetical protein